MTTIPWWADIYLTFDRSILHKTSFNVGRSKRNPKPSTQAYNESNENHVSRSEIQPYVVLFCDQMSMDDNASLYSNSPSSPALKFNRVWLEIIFASVGTSYSITFSKESFQLVPNSTIRDVSTTQAGCTDRITPGTAIAPIFSLILRKIISLYYTIVSL